MSRPGPAQTFFAVIEEGVVEEVEVYLDERLMGKLKHYDEAAWIGLIGFIEDDLSLRGSA